VNRHSTICALVLVVLLATLVGCEDSDTGTDLSGSWNGLYTRPGYQESLTATITQDGESLTIETTKIGNAHFLAGTISTNGYIELRDPYDGQTWTSLGPLTETNFYIRDFLFEAEVPGESVPVQGIYFSR
jgi:hypothetical protein